MNAVEVNGMSQWGNLGGRGGRASMFAWNLNFASFIGLRQLTF